MESPNGIIKTEALYAEFGKAAVNGKKSLRKAIGRKVEWFINYYNNHKCKRYLGKLPPVEFRLRNPNGTNIIAIDAPPPLTGIGSGGIIPLVNLEALPLLDAAGRKLLPITASMGKECVTYILPEGTEFVTFLGAYHIF